MQAGLRDAPVAVAKRKLLLAETTVLVFGVVVWLARTFLHDPGLDRATWVLAGCVAVVWLSLLGALRACGTAPRAARGMAVGVAIGSVIGAVVSSLTAMLALQSFSAYQCATSAQGYGYFVDQSCMAAPLTSRWFSLLTMAATVTCVLVATMSFLAAGALTRALHRP